MRPIVADAAAAVRSRKSSFADPEITTPTAPPGHGMPTTFFMATEDMLERSNTKSLDSLSDSTFGVKSLEETIGGATTEDNNEEEDSEDEDNQHVARRRSTIKMRPDQARDLSSDSLGQSPSISSSNQPSTHSFQNPHHTASPSLASPAGGSSLPSSPKSTSTRSFRHSDEESMGDAASQAIVSSEEEDEEADLPSEVRDNDPQLIMPSIRMPSRRPFTERGKTMGRLKVLIAGDSGVGKTSLIKSIVQLCEDIVHVDPLSSTPPSLETLPPRKAKSGSENVNLHSTSQITEVYASTRAYPSWWSDFEESKVLRRRKSMDGTVLERNLCFVDTPGYNRGMSMIEGVDLVMQYVESQLAKISSLPSMGEGDLLSLLSGNGGPQVDVVFYLVLYELKPVDLEFLRRLSSLTNVIPMIAKADNLSEEELDNFKASIAKEIDASGIKPFTFDVSTPHSYTVCSAPSNDEETMDASLLMSPDYVQPLLPSELSALVEQVFERDNISWLRHSAAKKFIQWRRRADDPAMTLTSPQSPLTSLYNRMGSPMSSSLMSSPSTSQVLVSYAVGASTFAQARFADHAQREERLAQIRLAKWAGALQRSLQNERSRYEALARGERASWLTERLGECVVDGTLLAIDQDTAFVESSSKGVVTLRTISVAGAPHQMTNPDDPLGLLRWNEAMKRRGWIAFQVVGSFGVIGALAVWVARNWMGHGDGLMDWYSGWWGSGE